MDDAPSPAEPAVPVTPPSVAPPLRLWPAWLIVALEGVVLALSLTGQIANLPRFILMLAGPLLSLALFIAWWLLASRAPWRERLGLVLAAAGAAALVGVLADSSARVSMWAHGVPLLLLLTSLGLTLWRTSPRRVVATSALVSLGWLPFSLARVDGFDGSYRPEWAWRWSPTAEQRLAEARPARAASEPEAALSPSVESAAGDWPGFRGPDRDSRVKGATIRTEWSAQPPREVWRIPVGPGWSSFAVVGQRLYTQEQRGDDEVVVCYRADNGAELWRHAERARFSEIVAGPGPRATPTVAAGRVFALGGTGILQCLDAASGEKIWSHDLRAEFEAPLPEWGFAASPLVTAGLAIVFADGSRERGLLAFDVASGELRYTVAAAGMNYSSPQLTRFGDREILVFAGSQEVLGLEPATGSELWRSRPDGWNGSSMVQPQPIDGTSLVVGLGDGTGTARLDLTESTWQAAPRWSSKQLKPSFNDFVFHQGHLYGFDQNIFTCLDAETGRRAWKRGRYGFGQVLLFVDQGLLLVLSEFGELVLLDADPAESRERARLQVLEGKTWNHPAFAHGRLYVRNGAEAVCLEL